MDYLAKINQLAQFYQQKNTIAQEVGAFLTELPQETLTCIQMGKNNLPKKFSKAMIKDEAYFVEFKKGQLNLYKTAFDIRHQVPSLEKITLFENPYFYQPNILNYMALSDQYQKVIDITIQSMNAVEIRVETVKEEFLFAENKQEEVELKKQHYVLKTPHFIDSDEYYQFSYYGNAYFKESESKVNCFKHDEFATFICQDKNQLIKQEKELEQN